MSHASNLAAYCNEAPIMYWEMSRSARNCDNQLGDTVLAGTSSSTYGGSRQLASGYCNYQLKFIFHWQHNLLYEPGRQLGLESPAASSVASTTNAHPHAGAQLFPCIL